MNRTGNITAVIMAGGRSSRMGTDKGLVHFKGKEMVRWPIEILEQFFKNVFIVANNPGYAKFGLPIYEDLLKDKGPLAGIYTALKLSATPWNFIVACDMPFVNSFVIQRLVDSCNSHDAVVPYYNDRPEPMCACYNKTCIPYIEKQLAAGNNKLQDFLQEIRVHAIDFTSEYLPGHHPFLNLNTMDELNKISGL
jgi:molybdopterin-guanine dinucleotide biosynthesis protein A